MNLTIKRDIEALAKATPSLEICGIVILSGDGARLLPSVNISPTPETDFEIAALDYVLAHNQGKILWVYHSHPAPGGFSDADKEFADEQGIIQKLYNVAEDKWYEYIPPTYEPMPLAGRTFAWGEADCYSLVRDYFYLKHRIIIGDYPRGEESRDLGTTLLANFEKEGFVRCPSKCQLSKDNILVFRTQGQPQHLGIYQGKNQVLHHPLNMLSVVGQFNGAWQQRLHMIVRHKTLA